MKALSLFLFLSVCNFAAWAQPKPIRLIVRGDDMGYAHTGNEALLKAYKEGIQTSIEILVPSPWFPEAVKMLQQNPDADVGIHLTLTSEWDHVKWRPLTTAASLRDRDGYFYPMIQPNSNYPGLAVTENAWQLADIEKEFRAQIELALKKIPRISHVSGHMGCTAFSEEVKNLTKKLALEYNIHIDPKEHQVTSVTYEGPKQTAAEKKQSFLNMLQKLEAGKTYIFVDHPGLDSDEIRGISHIGYEQVAIDRQGVTDVFTNPEVKAFIRQKNIQLISYKDLVSVKKPATK
ncbi:polysaccharide deacetylase family protein [Adhaeribacter pallidiroseus]|uniref:Chitin disaccharide deacetylase n=1 Tax=Adhaeribacter pallidiroseus TaxID=2072847 RepID=A0A369QHJ9_9BACT|nr:polysaccharide deacetylase family protein [Adhaeribacter pallidiroseus]RDC62696.1 Chitin disaccharide deacetylase [Adhaeribacter pallidiroseus]